ncbi:MAG: hypothetical protein R3C28_29965 [Pirellulaceae bacterium]
MLSADDSVPVKFLEGLRERGYFDTAIDYLDRMQSDTRVSRDFKKSIRYQQGLILLEELQAIRDFKGREEQLNVAQERFEQFESEQPDHAYVPLSRTKRGNILVERAKLRLAKSNLPGTIEPTKNELQSEAVQLFQSAQEIFQANQKQLASRLQEIGSDVGNDAALLDERDKLRWDYVTVRQNIAMTYFETADALSEENEKKEMLGKAEKEFAEVADKYSRFAGGTTAKLYRGICLQQLGKLKEAVSEFKDLIDTPDKKDPFLRDIVTQAVRHTLECWIDPSMAYFDAAIEMGNQWLDQQMPHERQNSEWLGMQLQLAKVYKAKADAEGKNASELTAQARKNALVVARFPSQWQVPARDFLATLSGADANAASADSMLENVKTYQEAIDALKPIQSEHKLATATIRLLTNRLPTVSDPQARSDMQQKIEEAETTVVRVQPECAKLLRLALMLAAPETPAENLNQLRRELCYFYYLEEQYYDAVVLGEFLTRYYPTTTGAATAGKIALASLVKLYELEPANSQEIQGRILALATLVRNQWPGEPEAADALSLLINFSVTSGNIDAAEKYLAEIESDSPQVADSQLIVGQALWKEFTEKARPFEGQTIPPNLTGIRQRALRWLQKGIAGRKEAGPSGQSLVAMLAVAKHHIDQGEFDAAIQLLDDSQAGPHTLAKSNSPLIGSPLVAQNAFAMAIQAYVGMMAGSDNPKSLIDKTLQSLDGLSKYLGDTPDGRKALVSEYVRLAQTLKAQIQNAQPAKQRPLTKAFEMLLERAAESANDPAILGWVGESYSGLGTALRNTDGSLTSEGQAYSKKALDIFSRLLEEAGKPDADVPENYVPALQLRMASTLSDIGNYQKSADAFYEILKFKESQVHVQIAAAKNYQAWGDAGNADAYLKAMSGEHLIPNARRNLVWGWGRLSQLLGRNKQYRELFHEARLNLGVCRYRYALTQTGEKQRSSLQKAKQDLILTSRLYPDLGGAIQKEKYSQLLQSVQRALGESPTGFGK